MFAMPATVFIGVCTICQAAFIVVPTSFSIYLPTISRSYGAGNCSASFFLYSSVNSHYIFVYPELRQSSSVKSFFWYSIAMRFSYWEGSAL